MKIIFNKPHSLSIFRETHIVEGINTICVFSNDIGYTLSFILANINFKNDEKNAISIAMGIQSTTGILGFDINGNEKVTITINTDEGIRQYHFKDFQKVESDNNQCNMTRVTFKNNNTELYESYKDLIYTLRKYCNPDYDEINLTFDIITDDIIYDSRKELN